MRLFQQWLSVFLALQLGGLPLAAQPVLTPPNPFQPPAGTGVANLRVTQQSKDGTEAVLTMDYTYDGFGGPTALAAPVIEKRDQKGVSGWFGADFASISRGRGIVSIKVRYFNDEPGVPPQFASDRLRILILNHNGTRVLSSIPFLKTIKWGSADAKLAAESISARAEEDRRAREAEARRMAQEKAEELAVAQARAREDARKAAEAASQRLAAQKREEKARQAAAALESARLKAEAEKNRLAEEKRRLEEQAKAQAQAQDEARLLAEAKAREEARLKAEAEARRLAEEKQRADQIAAAETQAREEAQRRAEAEEQRLAEARKLADTKAREEARLRAEMEAAPERNQPISVPDPLPAMVAQSLSAGLKSKVTSVDVVNRSMDRSQMTIGVEYEYNKADAGDAPLLGVDMSAAGDPGAGRYFSAPAAEIGKTRRNFALFPVKFQPPSASPEFSAYTTDRVWVYLQDRATARRVNLFASTMLLMWRPPGGAAASPASAAAENSLELDDLKQTDPHSGYVTLRYRLAGGPGKIRVRILQSSRPGSAEWFEISERDVKAGRGLQIMDILVKDSAKTPTPIFPADTIEIELLNAQGAVAARLSKNLPMTWAKPPE